MPHVSGPGVQPGEEIIDDCLVDPLARHDDRDARRVWRDLLGRDTPGGILGLYVLELANLQLEEFRVMDRDLDGYLDRAYDDPNDWHCRICPHKERCWR